MKRISLFILLLAAMLFCHAQRERNYIYLMDCTQSMNGFKGAPDIWMPTKDFLRQSIVSDPAGSTITVVPFQGNTHEAITFKRQDMDWEKIESTLDGHIKTVTGTNIYDAWLAGESKIDRNRDNYLILLTDGEDTDPQRKQRFKDLIAAFCGKYKNVHAFYVQLTANAKIDGELRRLIDMCSQLHVVSVDGTIKPFGAFAQNSMSVNTLALPVKVVMPFSDFGTFKATVRCSDPYLDVTLDGDMIENGKAAFIISSKFGADKAAIYQAIGEPEYEFSFTVDSPDCFIVNDRLEVDVTNKEERMLTLGGVTDEEMNIGCSDYYPAFLFCGSQGPDTIGIDLGPAFNEEARRDGSELTLQVTPRDGMDDFTLLVNGKETSDRKFTLRPGDSGTRLDIVFNPTTPEGDHFFDINVADNDDVDRINNVAAEEYALALRAEMSKSMNPLKLALIWAAIIILAALILWFVLLKPLLYPTINRIAYLTVSKPYYGQYKIKGARKVILSNRPVKQSALNRLFTGKVINKVNEAWTVPAVFEPRKGGIRLIGSAYVSDPYTPTMTRHNDYVLQNQDGTKFEISLN